MAKTYHAREHAKMCILQAMRNLAEAGVFASDALTEIEDNNDSPSIDCVLELIRKAESEMVMAKAKMS